MSYTYDAAGRRATMTVSGQSDSVVYTYDNADRLTQITQGSSIVTFGYDNANRRTSLTLPNGILVEYGYDAASRVTSITYKQNGTTVIGDLTYEYDKAGNRTKIGGSFARTGMPQDLTTTNYDAANRQLTFGDKTLTYDDNGNLQSITDASGTTRYTWNARNQLVGISGPNVNASFVYDGLGRREKKTISGSLTEFLYDGINPVQETSGPTVLANILTGLGVDEYLTRTDVGAGITSNLLPDALGSFIALADNTGTVQTEYAYEPFGRTTLTGPSNGNPFQYTGRENDGTNVYFYRNRYYHPTMQRFLSEDPIGFQSGYLNLYVYVDNNPVNSVDPLGLQPAPGVPGPGSAPMADHSNAPSLHPLIQLFQGYFEGRLMGALSNEIAEKIRAFEDTIPCGKQVKVAVCMHRWRPLGTVTVAVTAIWSPRGDIVCNPYTATGRKDCCPLPR